MNFDYDIIVIGGGAAGLAAATEAAAAGARTAVVEKSRLGGSSTWDGSIPSKTLIKSSKVYAQTRRLSDFGIAAATTCEYDVNMIMSHVREIVIKVGTISNPEYLEARGIGVYFGSPRFTDAHTVMVDEETSLSAKYFILATGSRPALPAAEGLADIDYLTTRNLFDIGRLPKSLAVFGGGPIGVEMAQALSRLGVSVSLFEQEDSILPREDDEIARLLTAVFVRSNIRVYPGQKLVKVSRRDGLLDIVVEDRNHDRSVVRAERIFVATGRLGNVEGLGLEQLGITTTGRGVVVDERLRTGQEHIFACGDIASPYQFHHIAEHHASIAVRNALQGMCIETDYSAVPWCVYTSPEIAHFGLTEREAVANYGSDVKIYKADYKENDRAITELADFGFAKVICDREGYILGAHIAGEHAGEVIHEYILAHSLGKKLGDISAAPHIYPTFSRAVLQTSEQYGVKKSLEQLEAATV